MPERALREGRDCSPRAVTCLRVIPASTLSILHTSCWCARWTAVLTLLTLPPAAHLLSGICSLLYRFTGHRGIALSIVLEHYCCCASPRVAHGAAEDRIFASCRISAVLPLSLPQDMHTPLLLLRNSAASRRSFVRFPILPTHYLYLTWVVRHTHHLPCLLYLPSTCLQPVADHAAQASRYFFAGIGMDVVPLPLRIGHGGGKDDDLPALRSHYGRASRHNACHLFCLWRDEQRVKRGRSLSVACLSHCRTSAA